MQDKNLKIINATVKELSQRIGVLTYERNALQVELSQTQVELHELNGKLKEYEKDDSK